MWANVYYAVDKEKPENHFSKIKTNETKQIFVIGSKSIFKSLRNSRQNLNNVHSIRHTAQSEPVYFVQLLGEICFGIDLKKTKNITE